MASPAAPIASSPREIRVFISSTLRDMQEERNELVKRIFSQLRNLCESRGVTWGEVDLRWGIDEETLFRSLPFERQSPARARHWKRDVADEFSSR